MNIKKIIICIACTILFSGCVDEDFFAPVQTIVTDDDGFSTCTIHKASIAFDTGEVVEAGESWGTPCEELRSYDAQIDNSAGDTVFDSDTYTPEVNIGSLEGRWMYFPKEGSNADVFRQSCELNEPTPNNFDLTCIQDPVVDFGIGGMVGMVFNSTTNNLDISNEVFTGEGRYDQAGLTFEATDVVWGEVTDLNRIEIYANTAWVWSDGFVEEFDYHLCTFIRLGDSATPLGQITINKYDFDGNLELMEQYDVGAILEKGKVITLSDMAGETLAEFDNNILVENTASLGLYGNSYDEDLFPGVDPYLFDGVHGEVVVEFLRIRQFDYVSNDSSSLNIDWLINRRQATRFERGDTIGNISLSF